MLIILKIRLAFLNFVINSQDREHDKLGGERSNKRLIKLKLTCAIAKHRKYQFNNVWAQSVREKTVILPLVLNQLPHP